MVPVVQLLPTNPIPELDSGCIPPGTEHAGSCSVMLRKSRVKIHPGTASGMLGFCPRKRGGGQNPLRNACQGLVARSLMSARQNGSEWFGPVVSNSRRVSRSAVCAGARTISDFSILSQHGSRPAQLRACAVPDLPIPSQDRILQMSSWLVMCVG